MTPAILAHIQDLRAAGRPPFVICEKASGQVRIVEPHVDERLSGSELIEGARLARAEFFSRVKHGEASL